MKVCVFGMGYVGCVSASCLAQDGHEVIGVDINETKLDQIRAGRTPVSEPGLDELIEEVVSSGRLQATTDAEAAVRATDVSLISVGTPSNGNGSLDLKYIENVCRDIGAALAKTRRYHVVAVRSTVLPGTIDAKLVPLLERHSGRKAGVDFGVAMNPEFLREGSGIKDYYEPARIFIGQLDAKSGDAIETLYERVGAPVTRTDLRTAEMVKYANNAFHALKVVFANEIGNLSKAHDIDGREVMDLLCQDRRLNISPVYLKPGFAFGGSCLPKDLRALLYRAKETDLDCHVLSAVVASNEAHVARAVRMVEHTGRRRIGILGLSFKSGTDDVRESPIVTLIETLMGRGYSVRVFDDKVEPDRLFGANRSFLERELPHVASLMSASVKDLVAESEVVVIAQDDVAFERVFELAGPDRLVIDLVGMLRDGKCTAGEYEGICW